MTNPFIELQSKRHSEYDLNDQVSQSPTQLADLIKTAIKQSPTAFNNQSTRAVITFGKDSDAVWEALTTEGLGASLQHYNPLIDQQIAERFDIPDSWQLRAEMPFGNVGQKAAAKDSIDDDLRFKTFGI